MEFKSLTSELEPVWDRFCEQNPDAWFWHTIAFLKYQQAYRPSLGTTPLHFLVFRNGAPLAICPLALETTPNGETTIQIFSLGGDSLPAPLIDQALFPSDKDKVTRAVFEQIDRLAAEHNAAKVSFRCAILTPRYLAPSVAPANEMLKFGYLDSSLQSQIIDLRHPAEQIWSGFRKSYHSLIKRVQENFQFRLLDSTTITPELFELYQKLHHKAAGRITRPLITFEMMHDWIKSGRALLAQVTQADHVVGCALINIYKNKAYYSSACNEPEVENTWAISHFIQWKIFQELQARGITHYELGWQVFWSSSNVCADPRGNSNRLF